MVYIIVLSILFLDQLSKFLATKKLLFNHSLPVIKGIFHLTLVYNRGAAFGLLKNQTTLFIITSIFAIILIYFSLKKSRQKKPSLYEISLSFILAGGLGNLIDRIRLGYVVDFLDFRIWPVFNLADSAISIGVILLGWSLLKEPKV